MSALEQVKQEQDVDDETIDDTDLDSNLGSDQEDDESMAEPQIDFSNVVYVRTLEKRGDTTIKVLLQVYSYGMTKQQQTVLCHLHKYEGKEEDKCYSLAENVRCVELNCQAIDWLANPLSQWSMNDPNEFFFRASVLNDKVDFFTSAAEPIIESIYERITMDKLRVSVGDLKELEMSRKGFHTLRELAPTIKFIMDCYKTRAKIPTIRFCMYALAEMEYEKMGQPGGHYESTLEKCYDRIKPTVIENMKLYAKTLSLPSDLIDVCFTELYKTKYIVVQKMTTNFRQIVNFISCNEMFRE